MKAELLKNTISDIAFFVEIAVTVVECKDLIKNCKNEYKAIAEILFYGFLKLISFGFTKLVSFILRKVAFFLKFIIEKILFWLFDKYLGVESAITNKVKSCYLYYVNEKGMNFFDYIVALFRGVGKAVTC